MKERDRERKTKKYWNKETDSQENRETEIMWLKRERDTVTLASLTCSTRLLTFQQWNLYKKWNLLRQVKREDE